MAPFRTGFVTSFYSSTLERKKGSWFVLILSWGVVYVFQRLKDASYKPRAISMSLLCGLFIFLTLFTINEYEKRIKHIVSFITTNIFYQRTRTFTRTYTIYNEPNAGNQYTRQMNAYSSDVILINDGTGTRYEINSDKRPTVPIRFALNIHASRENLYLLFHRYSMWTVSSSPIYEAQATSYYGSLLSHLRALSFSLSSCESLCTNTR